MKSMKSLRCIALIILGISVHGFYPSLSQDRIPSVLMNIGQDDSGRYFITGQGGRKIFQEETVNPYLFSNISCIPEGTQTGIYFDFRDPGLNGTLFFGLIHYQDSKYPHPVYRNITAPVLQGKAFIHFTYIRGRYDMTGWEKTGFGTIGYRLINETGMILYDGKVSFKGTGPFKVINTVTSGPFVNLLTPDGATLSFETSQASVCSVVVDGKTFTDPAPVTRHEIRVSGLRAGTLYSYTIRYGEMEQTYSFRTAPLPGSREKFLFAYSSDCRGGPGWGERNIHGTNTYIIKKIMALSAQYQVAFTQFTGDLVTGYNSSRDALLLEYYNWKNAVEPFAHHFPVIAGIGNHEALTLSFRDTLTGRKLEIDRFPYDTESMEALFAEMFVNPHNGPASEDGSVYDPDPGRTDFPSYDENVFYYTWGNLAMVCLNSDYWYTPPRDYVPLVGGNIHGYVMDNQLRWLEEILAQLENDGDIDHIFITIHTPFFPNGGHVYDDMWYNGNNDPRPWIAGKPVGKGIIERRDELLDLLINRSRKVTALLTGDEHNYCRTLIGPDTRIYPGNWEGDSLQLSRSISQINNGAAGAPYYAQETTPWTPHTSAFTTQNAVCLFTIEGGTVEMVVINPDTLEEIDRLVLK